MPGLSAGQHTSRGILRSEYLRFRALRHADPVEALLAAIPQAARWRLGSLPEYLNQEELARLMSAFEQADSQRRRDHAIVRCLVDLGLRSFEVAALRLEDIDWKNATLTVRVGKSRRADVLPLPAVTGHAIANYLHKARPATESRAVFVRHRAPLDAPVDAGVIGSVVRQAAARSGLTGRLHGSCACDAVFLLPTCFHFTTGVGPCTRCGSSDAYVRIAAAAASRLSSYLAEPKKSSGRRPSSERIRGTTPDAADTDRLLLRDGEFARVRPAHRVTVVNRQSSNHTATAGAEPPIPYLLKAATPVVVGVR
jgi:hypothetical protein